MARKKYTIKRTLKLENKDGNMDLSITPTTWHKYTDTYKFLLPDCPTKGTNEAMV